MSETKILAQSLTSKERTRDVILTENTTFSSLVLPSEILKGLSAAGFEKPSPIQVRALPVGRCGFDLIVKAKSGTGKTLIFTIVALESIKLNKLVPQVLILTPTREIAVQIHEVITLIGQFYEGLSVKCFIGGLPVAMDKENCKSCHIAIGTPGRLKQLIDGGDLTVSGVHTFVLDEADKLTEESFQNDINKIYNSLPTKKQMIMCSATYPKEMQEALEAYMLTPTLVTVELETPLLLGLKQYVRIVQGELNIVKQIEAKSAELNKILANVPFVQCVIFCNYQSRVEKINNFLIKNDWNSIYMSGAQQQSDRLNSLLELKDFKSRILVTTDLTARGIDLPNVDLVVNFDIPESTSTYLHRMGRAGRYGTTGICINLAMIGQDCKLLQHILGVIGGSQLSIPILTERYDLDVQNTSKDGYLFGQMDQSNMNKYTNELREIRMSVNDNGIEKIIIPETTEESKKPNKKKRKKCCKNDSSNIPQPDNSLEIKNESLSLLAQLAEEGIVDVDEEPQKASEEVYEKNTALVGVAKLLGSAKLSDKEDEKLMAYIKSQTVEDRQEDPAQTNHNVVDNIIMLAYKAQVSNKAPRWQDLLPEEEKAKLSENYNKPEDEEEEEEDYDYDYDFELEKSIEVNYADAEAEKANDYSFMEWIPVEPQEKANPDYKKTKEFEVQTATQQRTSGDLIVSRTNYEAAARQETDYPERYLRYYEHCSSNLWRTGINFPNVESFDLWFGNDWERQLDTVRNFVQNKIYLEEMAKYS